MNLMSILPLKSTLILSSELEEEINLKNNFVATRVNKNVFVVFSFEKLGHPWM